MADGATSESNGPESEMSQSVQRIIPEGTPTFYVNSVEINTMVWDITIDFGVILSSDSTGVVVRQLAKVIMSPQHAKIVTGILENHLRQYEEKFGPIPTPPRRQEGEIPEDLR